MENKGLEPENSVLSNIDNKRQDQEQIKTQNTQNKNITHISKMFNLTKIRQMSDSKKHVIDSFRAQYKHNEIPSHLIKLIKAWPIIPESVTKGILAMVDCYL